MAVVGQFAVAALSERRDSLRIQDRRSETAATKIKLTHYRNGRSSAHPRALIPEILGQEQNAVIMSDG
jgi:hypothetical protein